MTKSNFIYVIGAIIIAILFAIILNNIFAERINEEGSEEENKNYEESTSWPICTEDQMVECGLSCGISADIADEDITPEQDACYLNCFAGKECRDADDAEDQTSNSLENLHQVTWAGHEFEIAQLRSEDYKSDGTAEWLQNGFRAHDYSMPRTKLLDVDMNQEIKIKVIGNFEGRLDSEVPTGVPTTDFDYPFAEFAIYFVDESDSDETKYGIALLGTENSIAVGNVRDSFQFDWFSVENKGSSVIFEDSSGRNFVLDDNSHTEHKLSDLNQNQPWRLRINSHVNGLGYTKLEIVEIQIIE